MKTKIKVKVKKKSPVSTAEVIKQLNLAVTYAEDGAPESALRCIKSAERTLGALLSYLKKAEVKLKKRSGQ